jgi:hypothetical protein
MDWIWSSSKRHSDVVIVSCIWTAVAGTEPAVSDSVVVIVVAVIPKLVFGIQR